MKRKVNPVLAMLPLAAVLALTACASPTPEATSPTQETDDASAQETETVAQESTGVVNVYSARHYDVDNDLYESFTEQTGITVNLVEGKSDELLERIQSDGANSPADVFITVDAGRLWRAEEAGIFQPVDSEVLESEVPANLRHPEGLWFGLTTRARVLVYNTETVTAADLSTYEALAEPEWQDRVCIRSSSNIYNQSLLGSMIETEGVGATGVWVEGLVENLAREPEGGDTDQIKAVAAGQCDVAIANHYYWARLAKSEDPADQAVVEQTAVFFPNQEGRGTHVNISGAGVLANAPNSENAVTFLEFLVSSEAQTVFAAGNNEYPVVEGIDMDPVVSELGNFKVDTVNVAAYGRNNVEAVKVADRAGWK